MRTIALTFGGVFMTIATVVVWVPEHWLGADRYLLTIQAYAASAAWFALAANCKRKKSARLSPERTP